MRFNLHPAEGNQAAKLISLKIKRQAEARASTRRKCCAGGSGSCSICAAALFRFLDSVLLEAVLQRAETNAELARGPCAAALIGA